MTDETSRWTYKPLALLLYQRWLKGETVEQLARELRIPVERVSARICAAQGFLGQAGRDAKVK